MPHLFAVAMTVDRVEFRVTCSCSEMAEKYCQSAPAAEEPVCSQQREMQAEPWEVAKSLGSFRQAEPFQRLCSEPWSRPFAWPRPGLVGASTSGWEPFLRPSAAFASVLAAARLS